MRVHQADEGIELFCAARYEASTAHTARVEISRDAMGIDWMEQD